MYAWEISANYKEYLMWEGFGRGDWINGECLICYLIKVQLLLATGWCQFFRKNVLSPAKSSWVLSSPFMSSSHSLTRTSSLSLGQNSSLNSSFDSSLTDNESFSLVTSWVPFLSWKMPWFCTCGSSSSSSSVWNYAFHQGIPQSFASF